MIHIRAASSPGEVWVATYDDDLLIDLAVWRPGRPDGVGDIHRGRVAAVVPGLAGAFVALADAEGFLPDSQGASGLHEGDAVTVRVTRAAQAGKGPRLSAQLPQEEGPPGLLAPGPNALQRAVARHPGAPIEVDDPHLAPGLPGTVTVAPVDLDDEIASLADPVVALPGGLRATIEVTRALVAIDVDMAAATAGREPKAAAQLAANRAALPALARQIRLRNLSGAILIDPAGLGAKRRPMLASDLRAALAPDPLAPRLLGFTALGLAEIVRPRVHPPLHELLSGPHAAGLAALRAFARGSAAEPHARWRLRAAPDVVSALAADASARADLERRTGRCFEAEADPARPRHAWTIERAP